MSDQPETTPEAAAAEPGAKKKRNLTVSEKLIALRDQKRTAYKKLVDRVRTAEAAYNELKRQRNVAYEELQRIEHACPGGPDALRSEQLADSAPPDQQAAQ